MQNRFMVALRAAFLVGAGADACADVLDETLILANYT